MSDNRDRGTRLLSLAVHELRTPVSVVSGYLRMLVRHFGDTLTEQQRKIIQESDRSCGNLSGLLAELSDLANLEAGQVQFRRQRVPLVALIRGLADEVTEGRDRGVSLDVRATDGELEVIGDPDRLKAALNAVLTATLRERAQPATLIASCRAADTSEGRTAFVAIGEAGLVDTLVANRSGSGESFDEYRGGLGFRLVIACRVLAAHGGRIFSPIAERGRLAIVVSLPVAPGAQRAE
jgi:signal transduction histidine kinase